MIKKLTNGFITKFNEMCKFVYLHTVPEKSVSCACACSEAKDEYSGKLFKHFYNERLYRYLFVAASEEDRSKLVVVYQGIEDHLIYTRPLNSFFDEVNGVSRFTLQ